MHVDPHSRPATDKTIPDPFARSASGFPSPADDYREAPLDLHRYLVPHPAATFFMRIADDTQARGGFQRGDLLIVDRSLTAQRGDWIIAVLDGELCLQQLDGNRHRSWLCPAHPDHARIPLDDEHDIRLWGVVSHVIHSCRRQFCAN
ncbi:translesion error-prone DNA polymerase V autoproteolytic subunit [Aidingimonas lacisalsi]|uniref:translesion error-prone DNA polymerase V autoproteolytic subunit n=1 Tax=Aidingimonas lacisalsi TaxID=2604086 RepID=UPI0011D2B7E5|nr:translesion error-prone DNA polymerase V autoproteolytic subunit [Aidingimonas lacisalsi]